VWLTLLLLGIYRALAQITPCGVCNVSKELVAVDWSIHTQLQPRCCPIQRTLFAGRDGERCFSTHSRSPVPSGTGRSHVPYGTWRRGWDSKPSTAVFPKNMVNSHVPDVNRVLRHARVFAGFPGRSATAVFAICLRRFRKEGVKAESLRSRDEAAEHGGGSAAAVTAKKHPVLPAHGHGAQTALGAGMPTSGLCRHFNRGSRSTDVRTTCNRHNQRPSRKARRRSGGRYRLGTAPDGLEWASARSLSCMSACK